MVSVKFKLVAFDLPKLYTGLKCLQLHISQSIDAHFPKLPYSGLFSKQKFFSQEAKSEFRKILISKSAYFEVQMDFK